MRSADRAMFRLDDDLSPFYASIAGDALLGWAAHGAGRILASPTVFEDVVKTICTTNCAWSATVRMTRALGELGDGAFPNAERLAAAPESWFRDEARAWAIVARTLRSDCARRGAGALDLESLRPRRGASETKRSKSGCSSFPESVRTGRRTSCNCWAATGAWCSTRGRDPRTCELSGKKRAADSTIQRAFARYGEYAGLAFWLF